MSDLVGTQIVCFVANRLIEDFALSAVLGSYLTRRASTQSMCLVPNLIENKKNKLLFKFLL